MPTPLDALYLSALAVTGPALAWRAWKRHGRAAFQTSPIPDSLRINDGRPRVWFHGVSVGEIHLLRTVVPRFRERHPDWLCVVSASTPTGLVEARRCFSDLPVIRWPFDFSWAVHRALDDIRPNLLVLSEGELWPAMLQAAHRKHIPVALLNARFSPKSARRYSRVAPLAGLIGRRVDLVAAQTEEYAAAFRQLGVPAQQVHVTGSMKYDGAETNRLNTRTVALRKLFAIQEVELVWVAGSTQVPEEAIVLDVFEQLRRKFANLRLILVPRQKDRFDPVAKLLTDRSMPFARRSQLIEPAKQPVTLLDTIGELGAVWGLADLAFVGGSLDGKRGGQNMLEPAAYGAAVAFGPHVWNFKDAAARLVACGGGKVVPNTAELTGTLSDWIANPADRLKVGEAGQAFVRSQQGATQRTLDLLDRLIATSCRKAA